MTFAVGTKRTCRGRLTMSAPEGKTDVPREPGHFRFWPSPNGPRAFEVRPEQIRGCHKKGAGSRAATLDYPLHARAYGGKIWDEVSALRRQVPGDVQGLYARQKAASFMLDERAAQARAINVG